MTVSTSASVVEYTSGGPAFPIPYRFLTDSDIQAVLVRSDGTTSVLVQGTQYTLSGAGSQSGGTLTSAVAQSALTSAGASLTISRIMDPVQPTDLRNQGRFLAETHEFVFDRLTMLIQQAYAGNSRALVRPYGKDYYDAQGRQILNLGSAQGISSAAVNFSDMAQYVASILNVGHGDANNAANVLYMGAGNLPRTVKSKLDDFVSIRDFAPDLVDGDDFTLAFANAVAACEGRALWLPKGLYLVTDIQITKSLRIWGEPGAVLKQIALSNRHFIQYAADNIKLSLRGFTIDQNNSQQTFHEGRFAINSTRSNIELDIEDMHLKDFSEGAIRVVGDRNPATREKLRVFNNKFTGGMESVSGVYNTFTIFVADAAETVIEHNDFDHGLTLVAGGIPAISIAGVDTSSVAYTKVAVRNNKFKGYGRFTEGSGIGVVDCYAWAESVDVSGNLFEKSYVTPIRGKVNAQNVIISRNLCRDFAGIGEDFCGGISLVSATLAPTQGRYIISENIVLGAPFRGIEISATGTAPGSILVLNNIVGGVGDIGIYVLNCEGFAVRGNLIRSSADHGIAFSGCSGLGAINGNEIISPAAAGIISIGAAQASLSITIHENEVFGSNSVGITAENVAYLSLQNNLVKDVIDGGAAGQRGYRVGGTSGTPIAEIKNNTALGTFATGQYTLSGAGIGITYEGGNTWNPRDAWSFAAPTTGTWGRGDKVYNTAPTPGGNVGWVCTTAGTPGTWKSFGTIAA